MRPVAAPVLVLSEDPTSAGQIRKSLEITQQFVVTAARNPQEALQVLVQKPPTLLILDSASIDLIQRFLKTMKPGPQDIPVIVLSGRPTEDMARTALMNGASDFAPKSADSIRVLSRIAARSIERHLLMREVRDLRARVTAAGGPTGEVKHDIAPQSADTDALTGLFTRQGLLKAMAGMAQRKQSATIVMVDIRDLRQVNEQFGDDIGDRVLIEVGKLIQRRLGPTDVGGRYDGDCLVAVIPEDEQRGGDILRELRDEVHSLVRDKTFPTNVELRSAQRSTPVPGAVVLQDAEFGLL